MMFFQVSLATIEIEASDCNGGSIEIVGVGQTEVGENLGHFVAGLENLVYFNEDEICGEVLESFNLQVTLETN